MTRLPTRQVHLDFHTSPLIPDLLSEWDVDAFADTMKDAHVNSVTVFAKGHHGMSYYPTRVGQPHPGLGGVDLLGEMIEALRQRDIHAPVYYTVGWEERLAYAHPEWRQVEWGGDYARKTAPAGKLEPGQWWFMSFLHPDYQAHMAAEVEEICAAYPVEGLFFDICFYHPEAGFSDAVRRLRREHGLEAYTPANQARFFELAKELFAAKMTPLVQSHHPQARCFYNSAHRFSVASAFCLRGMNAYQEHWEIESLPSGFWGYYHFPRFARYVSYLRHALAGDDRTVSEDVGRLRRPQTASCSRVRVFQDASARRGELGGRPVAAAGQARPGGVPAHRQSLRTGRGCRAFLRRVAAAVRYGHSVGEPSQRPRRVLVAFGRGGGADARGSPLPPRRPR